LLEKVRTHKKGAKDLSEEEAKKVPDWVSLDDLRDYFYKATMIYCIQITLVSFILYGAYNGHDSLQFT